jgi:hypothetical protein
METQLETKYNSIPFIRALLQLHPVGSSVDTVISGIFNNMRNARLDVFFDELSNGKLPEPNLITEDYIHKYTLTIKYVLNTYRKEKIRIFAIIFRNSLYEKSELVDVDVYEELIKILDELGYREIAALKIYESLITDPQIKNENELEQAFRVWDKFTEILEKDLKVPKEQAQSFMLRIARTGCYEEITGGYLDYTGGKGKLTPLYFTLKRFIESSEA